MTRFGMLTAQDRPWSAMVDAWKWVEEAGFDSVWVADHFVSPIDSTTDWFEGWTTLAALATHTRRIRVGTLVSSMTLRNPALLARQAVTVDHISNGRLCLGVGAGRVVNDHVMTGVEEWSGQERADRFDEFVGIVRNLIDGEVVDHRGPYYHIEGAYLQPTSIQVPAPPLVVGALGPRMIRVAAKFADVWNTIGGRGVDAEEAMRQTVTRVGVFEQACSEAGRDPDSIGRSMLVFSFYVADNVWDSPGAFDDYVGRYVSLGFDEFIFDLPSPERIPSVESVLSESEAFTGRDR